MTVEYVNGLQVVEAALSEITEQDIESSKKKLGNSVLALLNNTASRIEGTEHIIKGMSQMLLAKMQEQPEKFKADFLVEAIKTLTEANNASTAVLVKTMTPQKEGEGIINLIVNNTVNAGGAGAHSGGSTIIADDIKLNKVNSYLEVAQQVMQADNKRRQQERTQRELAELAAVSSGAVGVGAAVSGDAELVQPE